MEDPRRDRGRDILSQLSILDRVGFKNKRRPNSVGGPKSQSQVNSTKIRLPPCPRRWL